MTKRKPPEHLRRTTALSHSAELSPPIGADAFASWKRFEKQVCDYFALRGFHPIHDINYAGRQNDILLHSPEEHIGRILVECKYRDNGSAVGVSDVESFASRVIRLRNSGDINAGYLITNTSFTASSIGAFEGRPESKFIFLRSFSQMLSSLINFRPYYQRYVSAYEQSSIFSNYVPLLVSPRGTNGQLTFEDAMLAFIEPSSRTNIQIVLGDYGTGKTTSCGHLFHTLARAALSPTYTGRWPCLIPLNRYNHTHQIEAFILNHIWSEVGSKTTQYDAFDQLNKAGLILLILDGFDEMAKRVTTHVRRECFYAINHLLHKNSKVILTGRSNYFPEEMEFVRNISIMGGDRSIVNASDTVASLPNHIDVCEFVPLSQSRMLSFLRKRAAATSVRDDHDSGLRIYRKMEGIYNLRELATRPILLEVIFQTLSQSRLSKVDNIAQLYNKYTDLWLEVDASKGDFRRLLNPKNRLRVCVRLAWWMLGVERNSMHYQDLNDEVAGYFDLNEESDVDYFSSDIRTCTFLGRSADGYYSFTHKSFQEYFCARYVMCLNRRDRLYEAIPDGDMLTFGELAERLPNTFHFLDALLGVPVSPLFWRFVAETQEEFGVLLDEESTESMDPWRIIESLAEGDAPLDSLGDELGDIEAMCRAFKRRFRQGQKQRLITDDFDRVAKEHGDPLRLFSDR